MNFRDFFYESVFDTEKDYWLKKSSVPQTLQAEIKPYINKNLKVLDLGCGGGRLAKSVFPAFGSVHGLDYSQELINQASKEHPGINYACGDFQSPQAWKTLGMFDLIISNCAIRKDYCKNLNAVTSLCYEHLNSPGTIILRIQAFEDLNTILPKQLRASLFYNDIEVRKSLSMFSKVDIKQETYQQKFSSPEYVHQFLKRININYEGEVRDLRPPRHYYIARAEK